MKRVLILCAAILNAACDVSGTEDIVDLCSNSSSYESYTKNTTKTCGCEYTRSCIRKCCQKGYYLQHYEDPEENIYESVCVKNNDDTFNVPIHNGIEHLRNLTLDDNFMVGMLDCGNEVWQYFKMNNSDKRERFYIQEDGRLYYPYSTYKFYSNSRYCIDEQDGLSAFLCYTPENPSRVMARTISSIGMLVSMPFLLLTFLVFIVVPNSSVHRRALMFYALCLFLAYAFLVAVQQYTKFKAIACETIGYSIIFFFMASFFWMNVMCIDTWFAFGGLVKFSREPKSEKKRFIIYCIYAWGLPLLHVLTVFLINTYGDPNIPYYPGVGKTRCFLNDNVPTFIYFYGPVTVIIGLNIVLFLLTSIKISKIKKDTFSFRRWSNKRHSFEYDKKKFHLYLKLLLAMGINWSLEIVSWAIQMKLDRVGGNSQIFFILYISDFFNAIYGFIVFLIFIYRKTVWKTFKKRVRNCMVIPGCKKTYEIEELQKSQDYSRSRASSHDVIVFA